MTLADLLLTPFLEFSFMRGRSSAALPWRSERLPSVCS